MGGEGFVMLPGPNSFPYNDTVPLQGHRRLLALPFSHHTVPPILPWDCRRRLASLSVFPRITSHCPGGGKMCTDLDIDIIFHI